MKTAQILQKIFAEYAKPPQIIDVLVSEIQILDIVDHLIKPCADRISVVTRILTEEYVEDDFFLLSLGIIALHHGQLVQVGQ